MRRMLEISLPAIEAFDNETNEFITFPAERLLLEHSLRSISKWEGERHESFFQDRQMSAEEFYCYVRCMTTNPVKDPTVYVRLSDQDIQDIIRYIEDPHTARPQPKKPKRHPPGSTQTSEDYYSAMAYYGISFECENWHFGRLAALIDRCSGQTANGGGKRMSFRETQMMFDEINSARLAKLGTKG